MNRTSMIHRVATALGEWASDTEVNGLSDWTAHDFTIDAEKFITTIEASVKYHDSRDEEPTEPSYQNDIMTYLEWRIDDRYKYEAVSVCLFEVGPEYTGLEWDSD